jgi:hypothetical protein
MNAPVCRIYSVGELTSWAKELLTTLQDAKVVEVTFETNVQRFCETIFPPTHLPIVFVENSADSRKILAKLRQVGKRVFLIWFGKSFSKEDLAFAMDCRVYSLFENARAEDEKMVLGIRKVSLHVAMAEQFDQLIHSLKALLLQGEEEEALNPLIGEFKTAVAKLERCALENEFVGGRPGAAGDSRLPFYKTQELGDALSTVSDLERTGTLRVRGGLAGQEGRVDFLQGKIVAAQTGEARGLKAIYRMFLWDEPQFQFSRKDPRDVMLEEQLAEGMKFICDEGEAFKRRFKAFRHELPPPELKLELDPAALHTGTRMTHQEFSALASVVEMNRVSQVIDYNPMPDVIIYEALIALRKNHIIRVAANAA